MPYLCYFLVRIGCLWRHIFVRERQFQSRTILIVTIPTDIIRKRKGVVSFAPYSSSSVSASVGSVLSLILHNSHIQGVDGESNSTKVMNASLPAFSVHMISLLLLSSVLCGQVCKLATVFGEPEN